MRPRALPMLAVIAALAAAGCGSKKSGDVKKAVGTSGTAPQGAGSPRATSERPGARVEVVETEYALRPANTGVDDGDVQITVVNKGQTVHALAIRAPGNPSTDSLYAGDKAKLRVKLKPGTYDRFCPVGDHEQRGMKGKLTVR